MLKFDLHANTFFMKFISTTVTTVTNILFYFIFGGFLFHFSIAQNCVTTPLTFSGCQLQDQEFVYQSGANNGTAPAATCGWGSQSAANSTWINFTYQGPSTMESLYASPKNGGGPSPNIAMAIYTANGCTQLACNTSNGNITVGEAGADPKINLSTIAPALVVGNTYLVRIYNEGTDNKVKNVLLRCVPPSPCGDNSTAPCLVGAGTTVNSATNGTKPNDGCSFIVNPVTGEVPNLACANGSAGLISVDGNVWYRFTMCNSGTFTATLKNIECNDGKGSQIWLMDGTCTGNVMAGQCGNYGDMRDVTVTYVATAGEVFYVMIDSYGGNRCTFSLTTSGPVCPLPIDLISFSGASTKDDEIKIEWVTASESNNKEFVLERAYSDQTNNHQIKFDEIAIVNASGNTTDKTRYSYYDNHLLGSGKYYYRLKQIDFNGDSKELSVILIDYNESNKNKITVSSEEFNSDKLFLEYILDRKSTVVFELFDLTGKKIINYYFENQSTGSHLETIQLGNIKQGIYLYSVKINDQFHTGKIQKH